MALGAEWELCGTSSFCLHPGSSRATWASGAHLTPQCSFRGSGMSGLWSSSGGALISLVQPCWSPQPGSCLWEPNKVLPVLPLPWPLWGPCDRHIVSRPLFAKCVSPESSSPHRVSIYPGLSGCQTHGRQEHMVSKTASASWSLWTNVDQRAMAWHRVTGAGREGLPHHCQHPNMDLPGQSLLGMTTHKVFSSLDPYYLT